MLGASLGVLGASLGALGANMGALWANFDALGANLDALGANLGTLGANLGAFGVNLGAQGANLNLLLVPLQLPESSASEMRATWRARGADYIDGKCNDGGVERHYATVPQLRF